MNRRRARHHAIEGYAATAPEASVRVFRYHTGEAACLAFRGVGVNRFRACSPSRAIAALLFVFAALGASCSDSPTGPTHFAPFTQTDLILGTGADAASGNVLTVNYTGWLYDETKAEQKGPQFDSSIGTTPFSFTLGSSQVIQGWDRGLVGMKEGGRRRLVVPPSLAYGGFRTNVIPPNATLLFEIDLVTVTK
jgi:FKBP-type peptidyl-prolyl cis-trans isomerase FkpA